MSNLQKKDNTHNKVMYTILAFMIFPVMVSLFQNHQYHNEDGNILSDTTLISGYSFFKSEGIHLNEHSNAALYNAIYQRLGTPHRSRAGALGLDCSGLVKIIIGEVYGITLAGSSRDIYNTTSRVDQTDLAEGDLVFFTIGNTQINHVGIYLNNDRFVHTSSSEGVTINALSESYYARYFYGGGRLNH